MLGAVSQSGTSPSPKHSPVQEPTEMKPPFGTSLQASSRSAPWQSLTIVGFSSGKSCPDIQQENHHHLPPVPEFGKLDPAAWQGVGVRRAPGSPAESGELDPPLKRSHCQQGGCKDRSEGDGNRALTGYGKAGDCPQRGRLLGPSPSASPAQPAPGSRTVGTGTKPSFLPQHPAWRTSSPLSRSFPTASHAGPGLSKIKSVATVTRSRDAIYNCHARSRAYAPKRGPRFSMGDAWGAEPWQTLCRLPSGKRSVAAPQGWSAVPRVGSGHGLPLGLSLHGPEVPRSSLPAAAGLNLTWALQNPLWFPCGFVRIAVSPWAGLPALPFHLILSNLPLLHPLHPPTLKPSSPRAAQESPAPAPCHQLLLPSLHSREGFHPLETKPERSQRCKLCSHLESCSSTSGPFPGLGLHTSRAARCVLSTPGWRGGLLLI